MRYWGFFVVLVFWVFKKFYFYFEFCSFGVLFHGSVERKRGGKVRRKEDERMKRKSKEGREGERKIRRERQNAFQ